MAFKEVSRVEIKEIIRQWQAGGSIRGVVRATGLARSTIQKYIHGARQCGIREDGPPPTEEQLLALVKMGLAGPREARRPTEGILASWSGRIQQWVKEDKLCLTRVQELLAQQHCVVSYTSLRRFVGRHGWSTGTTGTVRMADTPPGAVAEFDFERLGLVWDPETERRRVVWAMVVVMGYSRHSFVWPMFQQQLADVIEGLEAAWVFFQGIPRYLVLDNFPVAVAGADALHPKLTRGFLEYAQHRGFIPDTARVRHPKDKPKVEKHVDYVRERFFKGGDFHGLADLRSQARRWCLEVAGRRVHGTTRRLPLVVFQDEEQAALLPFDGVPYDVPDWHDATVHPDHHIAYRYALYSAPHAACPPGTKVEVRGDSKLVRIYHRELLVKVHPRQQRGGRSTDPEDYPVALTPYTTRAPDYIRRQATLLGAAVAVFAERLLSGPLPWAKLRQGQKLLRLGERYTAARLDLACQRALEVDLIDVRRLERILLEALEREAAPREGAMVAPPGRFARPGLAFAHRDFQPALPLIISP